MATNIVNAAQNSSGWDAHFGEQAFRLQSLDWITEELISSDRGITDIDSPSDQA
jgi:hypothetical protein